MCSPRLDHPKFRHNVIYQYFENFIRTLYSSGENFGSTKSNHVVDLRCHKTLSHLVFPDLFLCFLVEFVTINLYYCGGSFSSISKRNVKICVIKTALTSFHFVLRCHHKIKRTIRKSIGVHKRQIHHPFDGAITFLDVYFFP